MSTRARLALRHGLLLATLLPVGGCKYHSVDPTMITSRDAGRDSAGDSSFERRPEADGSVGQDVSAGGQDLGADIAAGAEVSEDVGQGIGQDGPSDFPAEVARPDMIMIMCGNGVREPGETCEPIADCTRQQMACQSDRRTVRTGKGNPSTCTFVCESSARTCGPADGFCLPDCTSDPDCSSPLTCVEIQFCRKPTAPNQGSVVCLTNVNPCTPNQRIYECTVDAREVCGDNHAKPVLYVPAIDGLTSG
jgi:hypothetical protein